MLWTKSIIFVSSLEHDTEGGRVKVMMLFFNNISILLVEETGVPEESHQTVPNHRQTSSELFWLYGVWCFSVCLTVCFWCCKHISLMVLYQLSGFFVDQKKRCLFVLFIRIQWCLSIESCGEMNNKIFSENSNFIGLRLLYMNNHWMVPTTF